MTAIIVQRGRTAEVREVEQIDPVLSPDGRHVSFYGYAGEETFVGALSLSRPITEADLENDIARFRAMALARYRAVIWRHVECG